MAEWRRVASKGDLDEDYPVGVHVDGQDIAIYLMGDEVYATEGTCTHAFALLADGHVEDGKIYCPLHQGSFDIRTGKAVDEPCDEDIKPIPAKLDGDDVLIEI